MAQEGAGISIPEGAQEMTECGPQCRGLVGKVVVGQRLDSMVPEIFSNLNDSVIL